MEPSTLFEHFLVCPPSPHSSLDFDLGDALLSMFTDSVPVGEDYAVDVPFVGKPHVDLPPLFSSPAFPNLSQPLPPLSVPSPSLPPLFPATAKGTSGAVWTGQHRGQLIALIGAPGLGKSTLACQWPQPIEAIIEKSDQGILDLAYNRLIPLKSEDIRLCDNYDQFKNTLNAAIDGPSATIVVENLRGFQALCLDYVSAVYHKGDRSNQSFLNYQAGPRQACDQFFTPLIQTMLKGQQRGKNIIFVGHSRPSTKQNNTGEDWLSDIIELDKAFSAVLCSAFSNVFHIVDDTMTEKQSGRFKASGACRVMYVAANPFYFAKNRMGLKGEILITENPRDAYLDYCKKARLDPTTGYRI